MSRFVKNVIPLLKKDMLVVETGTIRNTKPEYADGDGWSTLHLAEWGLGDIFSIDLDVSICREFLTERGLIDRVHLMQGSSLDNLIHFSDIDLAYLDSANDAELILAEFKLVETRMAKGGIVVIDDVLMDDREVVKGHLVVPYARQKYQVELKNRMAIVRGF